MESDADVGEPEFPQDVLRRADRVERFRRHADAVGYPRTETRLGRPVPVRQAQPAGQEAHFGLGQAGLGQRAPDAELARGPGAGPTLLCVVRVPAVHHRRQAVFPGGLGEPAEDLALAVIAAIRRVGRDALVGQEVVLDDKVAKADGLRDPGGVARLVRDVDRRVDRDRKRLGAKGLRCHGGEERAVHASAQGDDNTPERVQGVAKGVELRFEVLGERRGGVTFRHAATHFRHITRGHPAR